MIIYGLTNPHTSELRYVGKTEQKINSRLQQHLQPAYLKPNTHKNAWIKSLLAKCIKPEIFEIETTEDLEAEEFWIAYFKSLGCNLTNGTSGGEGWKAGMRHSEESRKKISLSHLGKKKNYDVWNKGKKIGPNLKLSRTQGGKLVMDCLGRIFDNVSDAANKTGISQGQIWRVVMKQRTHTHGIKFWYIEP